jgi:hypothetical protein
MRSRVKCRGTRRLGGREAGSEAWEVLDRRVAAGDWAVGEWEIAWAQFPMTLEKSDFCGARAGWMAG